MFRSSQFTTLIFKKRKDITLFMNNIISIFQTDKGYFVDYFDQEEQEIKGREFFTHALKKGDVWDLFYTLSNFSESFCGKGVQVVYPFRPDYSPIPEKGKKTIGNLISKL